MPLSDDWVLPEAYRDFARSKGWDDRKIEFEADRFKNHALASGRKAKDWLAAWRNWVTSPYQNQAKEKANGNFGVGAEIRGTSAGDRARELAEIARQRELAAGIGRPPDAV